MKISQFQSAQNNSLLSNSLEVYPLFYPTLQSQTMRTKAKQQG